MKKSIVSPSWGYLNGEITFSATVQIATDDYDEQAGTGQVLWSDGISGRRLVNDPVDWFPLIKEELARKANAIIDLYVANMTAVLTKTGKASVEEIIADVVSYVEGEI